MRCDLEGIFRQDHPLRFGPGTLDYDCGVVRLSCLCHDPLTVDRVADLIVLHLIDYDDISVEWNS